MFFNIFSWNYLRIYKFKLIIFLNFFFYQKSFLFRTFLYFLSFLFSFRIYYLNFFLGILLAIFFIRKEYWFLIKLTFLGASLSSIRIVIKRRIWIEHFLSSCWWRNIYNLRLFYLISKWKLDSLDFRERSLGISQRINGFCRTYCSADLNRWNFMQFSIFIISFYIFFSLYSS